MRSCAVGVVFLTLLLAPRADHPVAVGVPLPGGAADPAGRTGYLANVEGGLTAVDLQTGDVLWETSAARIPIVVVGDRLYAQAEDDGRLRVRGFDVKRRGARVFESDPVGLPAWASSVDGPGHSFNAHWRLDGDELLLAWEASAAHKQAASGLARIDLRTEHVKQSSSSASDATPQPPRELEQRVVRWQGLVAGRNRAAVLDEAPEGQKLSLYSWAPGVETVGQPRELVRGGRLLTRATLDGGHLVVYDAAAGDSRSGPAASEPGYVFDLASASLTARLPFEPDVHAVTIVGGRAYCLVGGALRRPSNQWFVPTHQFRAVDLKSGRTLWQRPAPGKAAPLAKH